MKRIILVSFVILALFTTNAVAGSGIEFRFFGINPADFKDRNPFKVIGGGIGTYIVHELGHYGIGKALNMDVSYKFGDHMVYAEDYYDNNHSDGDRALFSAGGFLATTLVGTVITAIPATRHSDYTLGFNGAAAIHDTLYGLTGGRRGEEVSDIHHLDEAGQDGKSIALTSGAYAALLTYISANKVK